MEKNIDEDIKIVRKMFYEDESFEPNGYVEIFLHKEEQIAMKNVLSELETYRKISDVLVKLIYKINDKEGCSLGKKGLVENCKGMTWCKQCIIDWARKEVEKDDNRKF